MVAPRVLAVAALVATGVQKGNGALIADHRLALHLGRSPPEISPNEALPTPRRPDFNRSVEAFPLLDDADVFDSSVASHRPVSPALRCVTLLTLVFFGVYLVVVCLRIAKLIIQVTGRSPDTQAAGKAPGGATGFEAKLVQASEAMSLAPMLCVLMISTRLRALRLDRDHSEPEWYVQSCMFAAAGSLVLRVIVGLAEVRESGSRSGAWRRRAADAEGPMAKALRAFSGLASATLYATSCCILVMGTLMEGDGTGRKGGWSKGPALSPMVKCIAVVAATFFAECALLEVLSALRRHLRPRTSFKEETPPSLAEQLSLHIPIMVCVLLVGIELRAVQLRLVPDMWMAVAMYLTVASVVVQAASAGVMATLRTFPRPGSPIHSLFNDKDEPGSSGRWLNRALVSVWGMVITAQYVGTTSILVSVFVMEEKPLGVIAGPLAFFGYHRAGTEAWGHSFASAVPPLSAAMRCTMVLTVVYFAMYLCMIGASAAEGVVKRWAKSVLESVQGSLAFVPMLCVMMIAVRLRAMQLGVRDPQPWAQTTMYVATFSVAAQAICSLCACASGDTSEDDDFDECKPSSGNLLGKCVVISLLSVRYIAYLVMYASVAVLVVALLLMEPALVGSL